MANPEVEVGGAAPKRTFRKFAFRGVDLDQLLYMETGELVKLFTVKARRRFLRGLKMKPMAHQEALTHLRNMIIVSEMIGSIIGPELIGHYLAEFSFSYMLVKHHRPGIGATHASRFILLE
ncbi:ribosomal protein S15 [Ranunculus cassubicifolius]